jgi:macrodomain Ter protein organizer (MatP/YcbG family)
MTNYDMDEIERQRDREKRSRGIKSEDESESAITLDIPDVTVLKLAVKAHEKGITLSKMINLVIDNGIEKTDYKITHTSQLLNETE